MVNPEFWEYVTFDKPLTPDERDLLAHEDRWCFYFMSKDENGTHSWLFAPLPFWHRLLLRIRLLLHLI